MTPPDSDAREVTGPEWACGSCRRWNRGLYCACCRPISLSHSLAQRILAALEEAVPTIETEAAELTDLAASLRAVLGNKEAQ